MEKKEKAPVLRFKDTNGKDYPAWELRKLGELGRAVSGVGFPEGEQGGIRGIPFYKVSDMSSTGNENIISFANNYVTEVQIRKRKWKVITTLPAILFAKVGAAINLNRKRLCNQPFLIDNNMMAFLLNPHLDSGFAKTVFEKINMPDFVRVGALPSIKGSDIECYDVFIPKEMSEQKKLGSFFKDLDTLITLHQRKLEALKKLKRTLLQKMFPKKGHLKPELRFFGFTNDWEQRKLKDFTLSYSGGTPTVSNKNYYNGTIPFIRSGEISGERTELFISEEGLNKSSAKRVHKGQILYALYGATSGEVSLSKIDGAINQAILAISTKEGYSNAFLSFWLRKEKDRITATFLQGGQGNLSGEIVKNLIVPVPSQLEQTKIGNFFNQLDGIITLHQRKLETYKKLKKGLLQKMFI